MRVIQIWFGQQPEFIRKCTRTVERFSRDAGVKYELWTDNIVSIYDKDVRPYMNKYKDLNLKPQTLADIIRYDLLKESKEYTYYIDADIYMIKNPFLDLLVEKENCTFFFENKFKSYINNTVIGATPKSDIMSKIYNDSIEKLKETTDRNAWVIGPKFIDNIVSEFDSVDKENYKHFYKVSMYRLDDFYRYRKESNLKAIVSSVKPNYGIHFFKDPELDKVKTENGINAIIRELEVIHEEL